MSDAERAARYRKNRRNKGFCGYSGCPKKSGDAFYCEDHGPLHAARTLAAYHRKRKGAASAGTASS